MTTSADTTGTTFEEALSDYRAATDAGFDYYEKYGYLPSDTEELVSY
jgi:hypothetical protein